MVNAVEQLGQVNNAIMVLHPTCWSAVAERLVEVHHILPVSCHMVLSQQYAPGQCKPSTTYHVVDNVAMNIYGDQWRM